MYPGQSRRLWVECFILDRSYFPKSALAAEGVDIAVLERRLREVVVDFIAGLACLPQEVLRLPVSEGGWSPLEIADHLCLSNRLFADAVGGVARGGDALVWPRGVLTSGGTMVAHESSVPKDIPDSEEVTDRLLTGADELIAQVRVAEKAGYGASVCFVNPYFGPLVAVECLQLAVVHVAHHHRQLPGC